MVLRIGKMENLQMDLQKSSRSEVARNEVGSSQGKIVKRRLVKQKLRIAPIKRRTLEKPFPQIPVEDGQGNQVQPKPTSTSEDEPIPNAIPNAIQIPTPESPDYSPNVNMDLEIIRREIIKDLGMDNQDEEVPITISDDEGTGETEGRILLKVPVFTGKPMEWSVFRYVYSSQVDENPGLTNTSKLYVLRKHLDGPALQLIKTSKYTGKNYHTAWEKIRSMYDHINNEIQRALHQLVNQGKPKIQEPAPNGCALCTSSSHETWECPQFIIARAKGKTELLQSKNLCYKCFKRHGIGRCTKESCQKCKGAHHLLLCYQRENQERRQSRSVPTTTKGNWDTNQ